ncbi:uncharacterized protein LOC135390688 isoform X2 [Ornithodoros turicata]|uniref:uncharacterized protein LOC135390688 isoform X2 n=1 Tax=Ornithodoros turicata TaxID=34597 RepID=UPI00313A08B8
MSDTCCVFTNRIFVARLKSMGRQCKVYIYSQFSQESNSFAQSETVTVTGLTNARQCQLARVDDFESLLRQLVLAVCCAESVVQTFPPSHSVIVGDILGQGYEQVVGFIVGQILSDTLWYDAGGKATAEAVSSGLKDTIASLQKQCCIGQTAVEKTNRTIAETDALIENLARALREKNLRGQVQIEAPDARELAFIRRSTGLISIVPSDDGVIDHPPTLRDDGPGSQTTIKPASSWAQLYGPRLLLGWIFNKEMLGREPDVHVTSPDVTFDVHTALSTDAVTVGACCPLPDLEKLPVTILVDFAVHSCTVDVATVPSISNPTTETVLSLRSQQLRHDLLVESRSVSLHQEWDQLVKDLFFGTGPGVYLCSVASSVLYEVNFTIESGGNSCTKLQVYVGLASQYSAFKRWLADILPDDASAAPPPDGPSDLHLNVKRRLMREADVARSIVQRPTREYASLRRHLLAAECDTDEAVLRLLHCLPTNYVS